MRYLQLHLHLAPITMDICHLPIVPIVNLVPINMDPWLLPIVPMVYLAHAVWMLHLQTIPWCVKPILYWFLSLFDDDLAMTSRQSFNVSRKRHCHWKSLSCSHQWRNILFLSKGSFSFTCLYPVIKYVRNWWSSMKVQWNYGMLYLGNINPNAFL